MVAFGGEDYSTIERISATGGFAPAEPFADRLARCRDHAAAMASLGIRHVTTHAGFIPEPGNPAYAEVLERVRRAVDALHEPGLEVGLETGQESAGVLRRVLDDLGRDFVGVNFDPANMILYGTGDPVEAARALGSRVTLVHAKDARWSDRPGETWGAEVPLGTGEVDFAGMLAALDDAGYAGPLIVEREGGGDRPGDLAAGRAFLESLLAGGK
jgi:sugar phosphate isomerase/epimerase